MKRVLLFLCMLTTGIVSNAQSDTSKTKPIGLFYKPAKKESPFSAEFGLATTNLWRGVDVGRQTCVRIEAEYEPVQWFTLSTNATVVSNQYKIGYGNMYNTKASFNYYNVRLGVQDVYFDNNMATPNDTDFFDFDKATTNHMIEAFLFYKGDAKSKIDFLATYCFYQNEKYNKNSWYLETAYQVAENTQLFAGYVVGPSRVSFQNANGFTNVGLHIKRTLDFSKNFSTVAKFTIAVNPSYRTVMTDNATIANRPVNMALSVLF